MCHTHHASLHQAVLNSGPDANAVAKAGYEPFPSTAIGARRCAPGYFKATVSNTKCTKCAAGKYQPVSGQKACLTCVAPRKVAASSTKCSELGCQADLMSMLPTWRRSCHAASTAGCIHCSRDIAHKL
jgi:Tyrosine-protein kinase ephrin type A/B receptor-like